MMKIYPQILFVTNREDFTTDYLILKLQSFHSNIPYLRINSEDIALLNFDFSPGKSFFISYEDSVYDLSKVKSVYFRRAPNLFPIALDSADTSFVNRERRDFIEGILLSLNAKWINPMFNTYMSERKPFQLDAACKIGLVVPDTIISNDPQKLRNFARKKNCIIKPISHGLQVRNDGIFSIYTSPIESSSIPDNNLLFEVPSYLQERLNIKLDIRVTIVDNTVFAVGIEKEDNKEIDWRKPEVTKRYIPHQLPVPLEEKLIELNRRLGIKYSAADLILTKDNRYIFLETNPAGEWVWLERELDLNISHALIKSLME